MHASMIIKGGSRGFREFEPPFGRLDHTILGLKIAERFL
jgi:hypothetical protein